MYFEWGRLGGVLSTHKRTTPKVFKRATPSWRSMPGKNYAVIRQKPKQSSGHICERIEWETFISGINMQSETILSIFAPRARNSSLNWMELPEAASSRHRAIGDVSHRVSIWNKLNTMKNETSIWNRKGIR